MKLLSCVTLGLIMLFSISNSNAETLNPNYDPALAKRLQADKYGMKSFVLVILKSGGNTSTDSDLKSQAFKGHLDNINRLVDEKKLIVAGPFGKNDNDFRGLFILDVKTIDEAQVLLKSDPAIAANYLKAEVYPWYGSAALAEYLPASDKVWQVNP